MRVWAPAAARVDLVLGSQRTAMTADAGGWFSATAAPSPGEPYWFSLDGGPPRPDPRSRHQPQGIDGPSAAVVFDASDGARPAPVPIDLATAVLYELHVGTFTPEGTFAGVASRLDHLVSLGVTAVELMPVAQFSGDRGWGYDGVDLWAPHATYGGPDGLRDLVDACHRRGVSVILDVVYNHLGPAGNHLAEFGPYFTDRYATPWGSAVNLDGPDSDEVRAFIVENALMWLRDYRVDGLRLDAVHALYDHSAIHILEELAVAVERLGVETGARRVLIAESELNDPRLVRDRALGGYGLDAAWSDDFHHVLHVALTGERDGYYEDYSGSADEMAKVLRDVYLFDGAYSPHRRRRHGRPIGDVPHARFLAYLQNHDQVGNRAQGERISHLAPLEQARVAAALVALSGCVPMLFQGEEWAASAPFLYFTDHRDADLGRAVTEGRRKEFAYFGWQPEDVPDPQDPETFERSKLDWSELEREPHAGVLDWYRHLYELRRRSGPAFGPDACGPEVRYDLAAGTIEIG